MDKNGKRFISQTPNKSMLRRGTFLLIMFGVVAFLVLGGRLAFLQIYKHDYYEQLAVEQQVRQLNISAYRGTIYDRNMKILAMSASVETIYISPKEIEMYREDPALIARNLSEILGVDYGKIIDMMKNTKSWYMTVARKVEREVADRVREFINQYGLIGVKIEADTKRYYPYSSLAAHVIGFVGTENKGLAGIESKYEKELQGVTGRIVRAKNSAGSDMLFTKFEDYYDAENGYDLILTVDTSIQYYTEKALEAAVADYDIKNGAAALVMDVNTGGLLAMVSIGGFDLNNFQVPGEYALGQATREADYGAEADDINKRAQEIQWRNKALSDTYEPGSTFKIFTLAMALEEGVAGLQDSFFCGGNIDVVGRDDPVNCWRTSGHGSQTLTQAVQHSCNVAFVTLGLRVGAVKFYEYARNFGFFEPTGIDLGGESGSLWWPESLFYEPRNQSQLAAASFGQTFTITPLQLITAVSACVNGGYLMEPYIVSQVRDSAGNVIMNHEPAVVRQVISEATSATICTILESVVGDKNEGTGKNAYVAGYRIGGKTGTSTKTTKEVATGEKEYIVSFIGVAPADNPQVAVLVILDNPRSSTVYVSGGQMAAPVVGKIMADLLPYLGVEPHYSDDEKTMLDKVLPNLSGMTIAQAMSRLEEEGLTARVIGSGDIVQGQLPFANAVIAAKSEIILYTDGPATDGTTDMPDVREMSYGIARLTLQNKGLFIRTNSGVIEETMRVSRQSIEPGAEVKYGTVIEVSLSDMENLGRY